VAIMYFMIGFVFGFAVGGLFVYEMYNYSIL
jgi:hypothetical protein